MEMKREFPELANGLGALEVERKDLLKRTD